MRAYMDAVASLYELLALPFAVLIVGYIVLAVYHAWRSRH